MIATGCHVFVKGARPLEYSTPDGIDDRDGRVLRLANLVGRNVLNA